jgi:hypothetical protein
MQTKILLCKKCGKYLDVCKCAGAKPQLHPTGVMRPHHRKNIVREAKSEIEWCKDQIALTQLGGETKPYTRAEWIVCMNRRIEANQQILKKHNALAA